MEPANIDWKNVESRYVRDEVFENIDAPKWVDLTDLDAHFSGSDDAWFCRPDCNHAKIGNEFKTPSPKGKLMRSTSEILPFGERNGNIRETKNLKRRGIGALIPSSSPFRSPNKPKKKTQQDSENQDPNLPPLASKKWKDPVKSSAEKPRRQPDEEREQLLVQMERMNENRNENQPKLRSTLSARNLFNGRDILGQISEFYSEIKRLAVNIGSRNFYEEQEEMENEDIKENGIIPTNPTESPRKLVDGVEKKKKMNKMNLKIETENERGERITRGVLKEVRENPPTPQRFLSPSPLKKPPKSTPERKILREIMEQSSEDQKLLTMKDENSNGPSSSPFTGENSTSMFWFLKPCTYLVD